MRNGNLYFCVGTVDQLEPWYIAIRDLIVDGSLDKLNVDTSLRQAKRWPAACGVGQALSQGRPIGVQALAVLFHLYDIDYDCALRNGEVLLLLRELLAGMIPTDSRGLTGEYSNRDVAMY